MNEDITLHCPQCEGYAREIERLKEKIAELSQKLIQQRVRNLHFKGLLTELAKALSEWVSGGAGIEGFADDDRKLIQRAREAVK